MKVNIFGNTNKRSINPDWFTGNVWMKELINSKEQDIYHVHFPDGARTKLHSHNGSQILIATSNNGSLITYEKQTNKIKRVKTVKLNKGDMIYIPPKTLHTHGSTSKSEEFSHIAINNLSGGKPYKTDWFEFDKKTSKYRRI